MTTGSTQQHRGTLVFPRVPLCTPWLKTFLFPLYKKTVRGWPRVRPAVNLQIARHNSGAQK
jgi:hypothetical protein